MSAVAPLIRAEFERPLEPLPLGSVAKITNGNLAAVQQSFAAAG